MDDLKSDVAGLQTNVTNLQTSVIGLQSNVASLESSNTTLLDKIDGIESKFDGIGEGTVEEMIDAKINEFASRVTEDGTINTIKELITYVADHGGEVETIVNDIARIQDLVGVDPVRDQITAAVAGKVDKVDGKDLSSNDFTDTLLSKLEKIEDGAQVNVIEKISVSGSILDIVDKTIDIPVAHIEKAGVVKSATGANMVNVANDGTMSVKKISLNSVFANIDDELVLDGGGASKTSFAYAVRIGNMGCNSISDAVACAENGDVVALQNEFVNILRKSFFLRRNRITTAMR